MELFDRETNEGSVFRGLKMSEHLESIKNFKPTYMPPRFEEVKGELTTELDMDTRGQLVFHFLETKVCPHLIQLWDSFLLEKNYLVDPLRLEFCQEFVRWTPREPEAHKLMLDTMNSMKEYKKMIVNSLIFKRFNPKVKRRNDIIACDVIVGRNDKIFFASIERIFGMTTSDGTVEIVPRVRWLGDWKNDPYFKLPRFKIQRFYSSPAFIRSYQIVPANFMLAPVDIRHPKRDDYFCIKIKEISNDAVML